MISPKLLKIIFYVGMISALETFGQGAVKYAHTSKTPLVALAGSLSYVMITGVLYYLFNFESMAVVNGWWNIITSVTVTLSGVLLFGETLRSFDYLGLAMIVVGGFFLGINDLGLW